MALFTPKSWQNGPAGGTPLDAAGFNDLEARIDTGLDSVRLSTLAEPFFVPHRGGGANVAPDNSTNAVRAAVDKGAKVLDAGDVWLGADGSLLCMHDTTVDRTTNGTGNTESFTAFGWRKLLIDHMVGQGWATEQPPTLPDLLRVAKASGCIASPEAKTLPSTQPVCNAILAAGMSKSSLIVVGTLAMAAVVQAAGLVPCLLCQTNTLDTVPIIAQGIPYISYPAPPYASAGTTPTDAQLQALNTAGVKITTFTLDRRKDWDTEVARLAALGITLRGLWSNDAFWVGRMRAPALADSFASQMLEDGMFLSAGSTAGYAFDTGITGTGPRLKLNASTGSYQWIHLGPVVQTTMPTTITFKLTFDVLDAAAGAFLAVAVGGTDDQDFRTASPLTSFGYAFRLRIDGLMQCDRFDGTTSTFRANVASTAPVAGTAIPCKIALLSGADAGKLQFTRTDTGVNFKTPVDTTYRGGALWFGKSPGGVAPLLQGSISDIVITP